MELSVLLDFIGPVEGHEIWDYYLYGLFFMGLFTMAFMGQKSTQMDVYFITFSVFFIVFDKLYIMGFVFPPEVEEPTLTQRVDIHITHFFTYGIRVLMFIFPLVVAGNTKVGRVRILAGLYAIAGSLYSFGRWYFEIRGTDEGNTSALVVQGALIALVVGELFYRWNLNRFTRIDRGVPSSVAGVLATDSVEVEIT